MNYTTIPFVKIIENLELKEPNYNQIYLFNCLTSNNNVNDIYNIINRFTETNVVFYYNELFDVYFLFLYGRNLTFENDTQFSVYYFIFDKNLNTVNNPNEETPIPFMVTLDAYVKDKKEKDVDPNLKNITYNFVEDHYLFEDNEYGYINSFEQYETLKIKSTRLGKWMENPYDTLGKNDKHATYIIDFDHSYYDMKLNGEYYKYSFDELKENFDNITDVTDIDVEIIKEVIEHN